MELIYILLILLTLSRVAAEIAERLGQAPLVGELIAGVGLGILAHQQADSLPILSGLSENEIFTGISDLAIFFLMMLAGMELRPKDMASAGGRASSIAIGGMLIPVAAGVGLAWLYIPQSEYWFAQSIFLAVALAITAVPVAVRVLMDLDQLDTEMGRTVVSAAVIDDALSLVLLGILTAILASGALPDVGEILTIIGQTIAFFIIAVIIGQYVFPRLGGLLQRLHIEESGFSMLLIAALAYAMLAEALGVHFILGAFLAGLFFGRRRVLQEDHGAVEDQVKGITAGFFAPVFFAGIGMHLSGAALLAVPGFVLVLITAAILSKLIGAGVAARMCGMNSRDSLSVGVAMSSRGAVELVIADIALRAGLFDVPEPPPVIVEYLFSAVVIMAITTTVLAPLILRILTPRS
ncbi:MAG: cation:proton antiporter [Pseudomonadales bacterium]|nr:cation:proton antiporter [Pseudomonadales bacterium]